MGNKILIFSIVFLSLGIVAASFLLLAPDAMFSPGFDSDEGDPSDPVTPTSVNIQLISPSEAVTLSQSAITFEASVSVQ